MIDRTVILVAVLGAGAVLAYKAVRTIELPDLDPAVFPYAREEAQALLVAARTTLPRRGGDGQIQIWGVGRSERGVVLNMQYATWAPVLRCEAVITALAPNKSRVAADCADAGAASKEGIKQSDRSDSALARTQDALRAPMFEEHVQATLNKRAFKRENASQKEAMTVFQNLGGMEREALRRSDEAQREMAGARR